MLMLGSKDAGLHHPLLVNIDSMSDNLNLSEEKLKPKRQQEYERGDSS